MSKIIDSLKKRIGRVIYMYRRELIIGLLGAGLGLSFYAIANLLDNPTNIKAWIGLISGIAFFIILFFVIKYVEK